MERGIRLVEFAQSAPCSLQASYPAQFDLLPRFQHITLAIGRALADRILPDALCADHARSVPATGTAG